ncbi:MAG: hypothetical protein IJR26_03480 [Bacteroidales bacterium]|nr:hypothetical protein [Bacteroidales bacterium]
MKIRRTLLAALFICLTSLAAAQRPANDVAIDGLHGKVKNVTKITYEARTDFQGVTSQGDILEHIETAYNSKGWRKTMTFVTPEANVIFRSRFKHDGFGLATVEQIVDNNEQVIGRTYYSYDAQNVLKEMWVEDADRQIESRTLVRYDAQGHLLQRSLNDAAGNIYRREVFTYSGNNAVKKVVYDSKGKKMQEWRYEYDDNNEPIMQTLYDYSEAEPEMYITVFSYEYDGQGNWTRRTESELVDGDPVLQYIITREIEYY